MKSRKLLVAAMASIGLATDALAVRLDPDGIGQALIYPYFTVQDSDGQNSWNTYLSVTNLTANAKALRVRFREGRAGKDIASFNLYLAPNDIWTAALFPMNQSSPSSPAVIVTADSSCTDPALRAQGESFSNALYSGPRNDGLGAGLDRTREGYVEIIEMATLAGAAAGAVTSDGYSGVPDDCEAVRDSPAYFGHIDITPDMIKPPTGGLTGTLTIINVNSGMDMGMNALALADLARDPFFRPPTNAYPGLDAAQVLPVSTVRAGGREYDLKWRNGVDAVSSVFMASEVMNEFVLDPGTASQTDWVLTFPTRPYTLITAPPFVPETFHVVRDYYDREGNLRREAPGETCSFANAPCPPLSLDHVAGAFPVAHRTAPAVSLLGSVRALRLGEVSDYSNGWMRVRVAEGGPADFARLRSEPGSTMTDLSTGATTTGRFELFGLPWTGFMVRTFRNGTLRCRTNTNVDTGCQGNYAGSFPHRYVRTITQVP